MIRVYEDGVHRPSQSGVESTDEIGLLDGIGLPYSSIHALTKLPHE